MVYHTKTQDISLTVIPVTYSVLVMPG